MKFLVDNQLPAALARFLADRGADCRHVLDVGLAQASDVEIWRYAEQHQLILISKDEDFFHLSARHGRGVPLVWVRVGNCRKKELLSAFERVWPRIIACLEAGDEMVEVR